jgi:hypothetical protein
MFSLCCTLSTVTGTETMATTEPSGPLTGTAEITESPRDPWKVLVKGLPAAAFA